MRSINGKITLLQVVDIFRGSASKRYVKYENLSHYGSGKSLSRGDAERLAQTLVTQRILEEYCEANGLGYVFSYVRVGRDAGLLDSGRRRISMTNLVNDEISKTRKSSESSSNKRNSKKFNEWPKRGKAITDNQAQLELIKQMDDDEECFIDDDYDYAAFRGANFDEELVPLDEHVHNDHPAIDLHHVVNDNDIDKAMMMMQEPVDEQDITIIDEELTANDENSEEQLKCFDQLLMLREEICIKENTGSKFLSNAMIGELSRRPPNNLKELQTIVGSSPLVQKHANAILKVTKSHVS